MRILNTDGSAFLSYISTGVAYSVSTSGVLKYVVVYGGDGSYSNYTLTFSGTTLTYSKTTTYVDGTTSTSSGTLTLAYTYNTDGTVNTMTITLDDG